MIEPLEARRLFDVNLIRGSLRIAGSERDDHIVLRKIGDEILVTINGRESRFDGDAVGGASIRGLKGNDTIDTSQAGMCVAISGDAGDDTIYGGRLSDSLFGGSGNDHITGNRGDDYLDGQDGDDTLISQGGIDVMHGGKGNDQAESNGLFIGSGVERVNTSDSDLLHIGVPWIRGEVVAVDEETISMVWTGLGSGSRSFHVEPTLSRKFSKNPGNVFDVYTRARNPATAALHVVYQSAVNVENKYNSPDLRLYTGLQTIEISRDFLVGDVARAFRTATRASVSAVSLWRNGDRLKVDVGMTFGSGSTYVALGDALRDGATYNLTAVAGYAGIGTADMYYPVLTSDLGRLRIGTYQIRVSQGDGTYFEQTVKVGLGFKGARLDAYPAGNQPGW